MRKQLVIIGITLILLVVGLSGCSDRQQSQDFKNKNPTVSIIANPTTGVAPLTVFFVASVNDSDGVITSYHWDFGDGNTSDEQNPMHTFNSKGKYLVGLSATDDDGGSGMDNIAIIVTRP